MAHHQLRLLDNLCMLVLLRFANCTQEEFIRYFMNTRLFLPVLRSHQPS